MIKRDPTWECIKGESGSYRDIKFEYQGCGIIEPKHTDYIPLRRSCVCEQRAKRLYEQQQQEEDRLKWITEQRRETYKWLGGCWENTKLVKKTFANFQKDRQPGAYKIVQVFAQYPNGVLVLHGGYGTGKTHLLAALGNELRERKENPMTSRFLTAPDLFNAIQGCMARHEPYEYIINKAIYTSLLVIDDIDKAKHTDFREEIYFTIIDKRIQAERPIAISTNRLAELDQFVGSAVASRLSTGLIEIEMIGKDYRKEL
jgi:DNA replication protein DnaC